MKHLPKLLLAFSLIFITKNSYSISLSRPVGNEDRIKVINYVPNNVIRFTGHYTYHSIIEFANDEEIKTITMGTPTGWQILPEGNRIFLKPIDDDATTNMTVITNKRMYFFEMHGEYANSINDPRISFITKFIYPENQHNYVSSSLAINNSETFLTPDLTKPSNYNFNYKVSGKAKNIEPLLVFDDGQFTYLKFKNKNAEIPGIFLVDSLNNEGIVNYRVTKGYVVVERVSDRFTLRHGKDTLCIFNYNDNNIAIKAKDK